MSRFFFCVRLGDWNEIQGVSKDLDCVGLFRDGYFWVLDLDCDGSFDVTKDAAFPYGGIPGDVPVVGKWSTRIGATTTRVGVVREYYAHYPLEAGDPAPTPPFYWVPDYGNANAGSDVYLHQPDTPHCFAFGGLFGDVFVTGDWTGTGITAAGVYRSGLWVMDAALPGDPQAQHLPGLQLGYGGSAGDVPLTGTGRTCR